MFSDVFLAQTSGEMRESLPEKVAYMACHFSPYGKGLSNMPLTLPPGSLLLLDDSMSPEDHDPETAAAQLKDLIGRFSIKAVLVDFQKEKTASAEKMVSFLLRALPCPVAVTEAYAKDLQCPVFLSPTPVNMALQKHLAPWAKQGVYLEIAPAAVQYTVTKDRSTSLPLFSSEVLPLFDERLHCHYKVEVFPEKAVFTLRRTREDLAALAGEAKQLGVLGTVGLYQELGLP